MHLRWDKSGRKVHLAMPGYVEKALREFLHEYPTRKQYSHFPCAQKKVWKEAQMIRLDYRSAICTQKIVSPRTSRAMYDNSETTVRKLLTRRIQICFAHFSVINCLAYYFLKQVKIWSQQK